MFPRNAETTCRRIASQYPVLAILGPRQSGKTMLAKAVFPGYKYVSLEDLDMREFAAMDKSRIGKFICSLDKETMDLVNEALRLVLEL